jgi:hypothetical protein
MIRTLETLRSGAWLTRERVRLVAIAVLLASVAGLVFLLVTAHGMVDVKGRPLGTDFSNVYAAGTYVRDGRPEAAYDPPLQHAREQQIFGTATPFYGWHYPPFFLFIAAALAMLPYGIALAVWQASTLGLYLLSIGTILRPVRLEAPAMSGLWLLVVLGFPAVVVNIGHGQNGLLTAALFGFALAALDRRPIMAGVLFALMAYKPQFGLMIPLALAAGGRWRAFAAAATTMALLMLVTTAAFGPQIWQAFIASTRFTREVALEQGDTGWYKIQSLFAWARMWGAPVSAAYALQTVLSVAIAAALVGTWRGPSPLALKSAALCLAAILATPYSFDYDMTVLAPAIAFFCIDGLRRGFEPWEKSALAVLWITPFVARSIAQLTLVPLGVPMMLIIFILLLRRSTSQFGYRANFQRSIVLK